MALRLLSRVVSTSLDVSGDVLPSEFLIFRRGLNSTRKGDFVYDDEAAAEVLAEYQAGGIQLCLDLEHDSLDPKKREARADAADAMGWYDLEQKSDGSLWAVNVRWSSEGERRLRGKLQRYTSPAFFTTEDDGTERPARLINVALCAMPATLDAAPLIAATEHILALLLSSANPEKRSPMKPKQKKPIAAVKLSMTADEAKKALDVITSKDGNAALELVTQLLASAASGGEAVTEPPDDEAAPELAEPVPPPAPGAPPAPVAEKKTDEAAALSLLTMLMGPGHSVSELSDRFATLTTLADQVAADRAGLELNQRRDLIAKLVKLGYETPATAWEGDPAKRMPKKRMLAETIPEMTERVALLEKSPVTGHATPKGEQATGGGKVITLSDGVEVSLTASEVSNATAAGATLEAYAANKHVRDTARSKKKGQ